MSGNLSRVERLSGRLIGAHLDVMEQAPPGDRDAIVADALLLCLVAGGSGVIWGIFWSMFGGSGFVGIPAGIYFGLLMGLIERAVGNEWALTGILRRPGMRRDNEHWFRLATRGFITFVCDYTTSTAVLMLVFHIAIMREVERDRFEQNKQITAYWDDQKAGARKQSLGLLIADEDRFKAIEADTSRALDAARLDRANALSQKQIADTEADRELRGHPGYRRGAGTNYRDALKKKQDADTAQAKAEAQISIYESRLTAANAKLDAASAALRAGDERIRPDLAKLEDQKQARLIPEGYDAMMGYKALLRIYASGTDGPAARDFGRVIFMTLVTMGLSFVVVRLIFAPASIYTALLIKKTKIAAERINAEYEAESHQIRVGLEATIGPRPPRPPLRIVGEGARQ